MNGLEKHLGPKLGNRPIGTITREELLDVLMVMDSAKLFTYVRTVRMWVAPAPVGVVLAGRRCG